MATLRSRLATGVVLMALVNGAVAQSPPKAPADPHLLSALQQVSAAQLKANVEKLAAFGTRHTLSADPAMNAKGRGIGAAREWIRAEFERYSQACNGCLEVRLDSFIEPAGQRIPQPTEIVNVYAVLRGTQADNAKRMYVIGAHYDSRATDPLDAVSDAPGANDDGSGTAAVLEAARVLSKQRFPATIIFIAFAGEEQGLHGARHFATMAKEQGWNIEAVLNNDTVGGDRDKLQQVSTLRVFSEGIPATAGEAEVRQIRGMGGENDSPSRQLARYLAQVARQYFAGKAFTPALVFRPDRYLRGGDHTAFNQQGFAAVRLTEYRENYHHQHQNLRSENGIEYGDLPKFVNYDYLANVTRLNVAALASLASAPAPPANVRLETKDLTNESTLVWEPSPGALAASYEVLWRDSAAPDWTHAQQVGKVTRVTLPLSKDNVIFAVRALDGKGHASLAVLPRPER